MATLEESPMEVDDTDTGNVSQTSVAEAADSAEKVVLPSNQGDDSSLSEKNGSKTGFENLEINEIINVDNGNVDDENARDGNEFEDNDNGDEIEHQFQASNSAQQEDSADGNSNAEDPFGFEANVDLSNKEDEQQDKITEGRGRDGSSSSNITPENAGGVGESSESSGLAGNENKSQDEGEVDVQVIDVHEQPSDETIKSGVNNSTEGATGDDEFEQIEPVISVRVDGIFESNDNEEDEEIEAAVDPEDIKSMLQVDYNSDNELDEVNQCESQDHMSENEAHDVDQEQRGRSRPRRAAAAAAATTIREITVVEEDVEEHRSRRKRKDDDSTFNVNEADATYSPAHNAVNRQKCVVCKKTTVCQIKIQQFGTDVYICSNACFNNMRYPSSSEKKRLPCCQCGITSRDDDTVYYWETMNFCSDLCVGIHQLAIGASCATCSKKCPWLSIGKYCVRFGSDIRQFCTASCLESYKKNARVCFHCQLDIKRLGNVILANIPSKTTPKEFCSKDCVEMYVEQNLHQTVRSKNTLHFCSWCKLMRECFRELVLHNEGNVKTCSQTCFNLLVESKQLRKCQKCETCSKYINMEYTSELPPHYVSTQKTLFGFCSATCKNVFVLKNREILSCVTCKVKKYNYDLVQIFAEKASQYAVCSLNCLPKSQDYINKLKDSLFSANPVPLVPEQRHVTASSQFAVLRDGNKSSGPVINSVTSLPNRSQGFLLSVDGSQDGIEISENPDGTYSVVTQQGQQQTSSSDGSSVHYQVDLNTSIATEVNGFDSDPRCAGDACQEEFSKWDGVLRAQDIEAILERIPPYVEMADVYTMAKPKTKEIETQTDESELADMNRVPLKVLEKTKYVPMPIPYPVYIPAPFYLCEAPVPFLFPFPVPIPIPVPIMFDGNGIIRHSDRLASLLKNVDISPKANGVAAMDTSHNTSESDIVEIDVEPDDVPEPSGSLVNGCIETERSGLIEMMDCTSPIDRGIPISPDNIPEPSAIGTSSNSSNNVVPMNASPACGSPVRSSGANSPFLNALMNSSQATGSPTSENVSSPGGGRRKLTRVEYGLRAWKTSFGPTSDPLNYSSSELASKLAGWVKKGTKPNGERYRADIILYLCLGVQQHMHDNNRRDNIFFDAVYQPFLEEMTNYAETDCAQGINTRIEDSHFWESGQLGSASPGVLLFTLVYFLYKNFNLKTWEKLANLHFNDIRVEPRDTDVLNAFHPKVMTIDNLTECEGMEVVEDPENANRCPIKYYETYKSKCLSVEGPFFKAINEDFSIGGRDWFGSESLNQMQLYRMLIRAMMIKTVPEIR